MLTFLAAPLPKIAIEELPNDVTMKDLKPDNLMAASLRLVPFYSFFRSN